MSYYNPYLIRASETVESDDVFLRLLSAEPLARLQEKNQSGNLWGKTLYVRSSPGGGKTTLLRLFSPSILHKIASSHKQIYTPLSHLDVIDGPHINRAGVYLLISRDYAFLEDEDLFSEVEQKRAFYALLNARLLLATLKSGMQICKISKDELSQVEYRCPDEVSTERIVGHNAQDLLAWAREIETKIISAFDNYDTDGNTGHNSLFVFDQIKASYFYYEGKPICKEFIFQLDDVHKLTDNQKRYLREEVIETRRSATIWIAERLESLTTTEILEDNNIPHRDYAEIRLDDLSRVMSATLKRIAEVRSNYSTSGIVLTSSLSDINPDAQDSKYARIIDKYKARIQKYPVLSMVDNWLPLIENKKSKRDVAVYYRTLLIFLARKGNASGGIQMRLFPYGPDEMEDELKALLPLTEKIFDYENNLVSYYGEQTLYDIASNNIEQFLRFSSVLYELLLSKRLSSPNHYDLTTNEQDDIYKKESKNKFDEILRLRDGQRVSHFLKHIMDFCCKETYTDANSYKVVSGFAVLEENGKDAWFQIKENKPLADMLRICLAYNLLSKFETTQGAKDQKWSVFYINRWLCVYCGIPLDRGGWRKISVKKLNTWV